MFSPGQSSSKTYKTTFLTYNNHCKPIKTSLKLFCNDLTMGLYMVLFCFLTLVICQQTCSILHYCQTPPDFSQKRATTFDSPSLWLVFRVVFSSSWIGEWLPAQLPPLLGLPGSLWEEAGSLRIFFSFFFFFIYMEFLIWDRPMINQSLHRIFKSYLNLSELTCEIGKENNLL